MTEEPVTQGAFEPNFGGVLSACLPDAEYQGDLQELNQKHMSEWDSMAYEGRSQNS